MLEGCGSRLAIRAKSSTNPGGRGLGLRFQRVDLEAKHDVKLTHNTVKTFELHQLGRCRFLPFPK